MKTLPSAIAATAFAVAALYACLQTQAQTAGTAMPSKGTLHGPVTHKNLQIFLVTGEDRLKDVKVKLLEEAMKEKTAVVHETGNVNKLSIENHDGDAYVFVQSGDIVKGGQQDRTLPNDFLVKAKSGKLPIDAFCVESGRWQQRGKENAGAFSGSTKVLSSNKLKYAAKVDKDQGKVWSKVAEAQKKLSDNVYKGVPAAPRQTSTNNDAAIQQQGVVQVEAANTGGSSPAPTNVVNDAQSATSLQLALENKDLAKMTQEYTEALEKAPDQVPAAVGFAYAVNGVMTGAEVYANGDLFRKLWPKLLESVVHEAIAEQKEGGDGAPVVLDTACGWLDESEAAKSKRDDYPAGNATIRKDGKDSVRFDTLVPAAKGKAKESDWIHRSVLKKEKDEK